MSTTKTILSLALISLPLTSAAQGIERLTAIPFVRGDSIGELVFGFFLIAIVIAAVLAVVKLVIAGVKYMVSDVVSTKESAKSDIKGAVLGLLLILATVLIVNLINPDIADTNISLPPIDIPDPPPPEEEDPTTPGDAIAECESNGGTGAVAPMPGGGYAVYCGTVTTQTVETLTVDDQQAAMEHMAGLQADGYEYQTGGSTDLLDSDELDDQLEEVVTDCRENFFGSRGVRYNIDDQSVFMCFRQPGPTVDSLTGGLN